MTKSFKRVVVEYETTNIDDQWVIVLHKNN